MKKNTKTYLLITAVALIWGTIGYKILATGAADPIATPVVMGTFKPLTQPKKVSFTVAADYRDPFLGTLTQKPKKKGKRSTKPKTPPAPEIPILYTGLVTEDRYETKRYSLSPSTDNNI